MKKESEKFLSNGTPILKVFKHVPFYAKRQTGGMKNGVLWDGWGFFERGKATIYLTDEHVHVHLKSSDGFEFAYVVNNKDINEDKQHKGDYMKIAEKSSSYYYKKKQIEQIKKLINK